MELERAIRETTCRVACIAYNMGIHGISLGSNEIRSPASSQLAGFRFLCLFILALQSHAAQDLGLLLLAIDLVIHSAICRSGNNTNDFPGGLAIGIHFLSPEIVDLVVGFGTS